VIAALVGMIGYTVGASDQEEAAAQAAPSTPELIPLTDAYTSGRSEGYRRGRLRAYRQGRFDGLEEGRRAERRRLRRVAERIRRKAAIKALSGLEPGVRYELCRRGSAVCSVTPPGRSAR
jgi:hypothetical protein